MMTTRCEGRPALPTANGHPMGRVSQQIRAVK